MCRARGCWCWAWRSKKTAPTCATPASYIVKELAEYDVQADVYDPWVSTEDAQHEYGITPVRQLEPAAYDAIIIAVAHEQFKSMGAPALRALGKPQHVLYDLKYVLPAAESDMRL